MKTLLKTLIATIIVFTVPYTSTIYAADFGKACEMYLHHKFTGPRYLVYQGAEVGFVGKTWNDQVSSVKVPAGCHLKVYLHSRFKGFDKTYTPGTYSYIGNSWNDNISSVKCICN